MMYKMLFHVDELEKWELTLGNIKNLLNELNGSKAKLEVIINSNAVIGVLEQVYRERIEYLFNKNVIFKVCNNSLRSNNILKEKLPKFVIVVPAGVLEIMRLQNEEGFAYIKP